MLKGYVHLYRRIVDNKIFKRPMAYTLFSYLIIQANHTNVERNGKTYYRGEVITSTQKIADILDWSKKTVINELKWLEDNEYIARKKDLPGTHLMIINYDKYQGAV